MICNLTRGQGVARAHYNIQVFIVIQRNSKGSSPKTLQIFISFGNEMGIEMLTCLQLNFRMQIH